MLGPALLARNTDVCADWWRPPWKNSPMMACASSHVLASRKPQGRCSAGCGGIAPPPARAAPHNFQGRLLSGSQLALSLRAGIAAMQPPAQGGSPCWASSVLLLACALARAGVLC